MNAINQNEIEQRLSAYGNFLVKRQMVASGKKIFIVWLKRYFKKEPCFKGHVWEDKLPQFLNQLSQDPQWAPWQIDQAEQAVRLYFFNFYARQKTSAKKSVNGRV